MPRNNKLWLSTTFAVITGVILPAGCGGDARVDLAAAGAMESLADAMATALDEYHADLELSDAAREADVVAAFITRMQRDAGDPALCAAHADAFTTALRRLRADQKVSTARQYATADNLATLREVARGLRRMAVESMSLNDEARRYVDWLVESAGPAQREPVEVTQEEEAEGGVE